jgi:hopanoid biosynthesis associated protein HpnK
MKRLVVNADDFGLTENTNQGIAEAHRRGILTSATLLANGEAFDSAVELARGSPELGVGVHLNLTHGLPVSDHSLVPSLVDHNGHLFDAPAKLARRILAHRVCLAEVERELAAQIEKVQASGIAATHLDSHKHVHMLPGVFPVVVRLAQQYRISGVRLAVERTAGLGGMLRSHPAAAGTILMQHLQGRALALLAPQCRERLRQAKLASSMYFFGITQTGFLDGEALDTLLWNLPEGSSELMCHPGYADDALRQTGTRLVQQRERELQALTRPATRKLVAALGIQLVDYRGLIQD